MKGKNLKKRIIAIAAAVLLIAAGIPTAMSIAKAGTSNSTTEPNPYVVKNTDGFYLDKTVTENEDGTYKITLQGSCPYNGVN